MDSPASIDPQDHWPHAPLHRLSETGTYFVTASTYLKQHHFRKRDRLDVLQRGLLRLLKDFGWHTEAWALFSNHYHFVAHSPETESSAESLRDALSILHEKTAKWINGIEKSPGRKVWYNFWETHLTFEKSYMVRLSYTHQNAVRHGLVNQASHYPWCSASWFEQTSSTAQVRTVYSFKTDTLRVNDDYEVIVEDWQGI